MKTNTKLSLLALLTLILLLSAKITLAQGPINYKAASVSYRISNFNDIWGNWSEPETCSKQMCLNIDSGYFTIETNEGLNVYNIITKYSTYTDKDLDKITKIYCYDKDGVKCNVLLVKTPSTNTLQIYIHYLNSQYCFNVYTI